MSLNKPHNLIINSDASSSRFVIDLKQNFFDQEIEPAKIKKPLNIEEKLEKLAEINYGKYFKAGKKRANKNFTNLFNYTKMVCNRSFWIPASLVKYATHLTGQVAGMTKESAGMTKKKTGVTIKNKVRNDGYLVVLSNQLALIGLGKLLFVSFYKICYAAGWLIMFILRFAYFLFLALVSPFVKIIKFLFFKSQISLYETLKSLPPEPLAGQSLKMVLSAKLFYFIRTLIARIKKIKINWKKENILPRPNIGYLKPVLVFAGVLLIIVLPVKAFTYYKVIDIVKGKVMGASESALDDLISAGQSVVNFNFSQASQDFESAGSNFLNAQKKLEEINGSLLTLAVIVPNKNLQLAAASRNILRAGELSANAGKNLSLAMDSLFNYKAVGFDNILENLSFYGHKAVVDLSELTKALDRVNSEVLPENYQKEFILLKQKIGQLSFGLKEFISLADSLKVFLGMSADKRYLLVFQNNSELRASGGFIGSFALIDFSQGKIKNIEVPGGGSYDTEAGWLKKIKSPEPLSLIRADWHFWDANWWPDWPTSAKKLAWFYENSDGSTVNGVISFTPAVMEKLLAIIGPVDLSEKYGSTTLSADGSAGIAKDGLIIGADNFWLETQKLAEQKSDVTRQPKKIIGDLMNKIIEELPKRLSKDNLVLLLKVMEESLVSKNILFYFTDKDLEAKADDLGWSGRIKDTAGDYLSVINTNIAGGKSDRKIKQEIIHQAKIQSDGSIVDDLTIRRIHEAVKREPFSGVRNVNWLRVYVPLGSELIEANGFKPVDKIFFKEKTAELDFDPEVLASEGRARIDEISGTKIYNEFNKTVFANWSQLDPGETIEIHIKYRLPFKLTEKKPSTSKNFSDQLINKADAIFNFEQKKLYSYSLLAQKQPGMNSSIIKSDLKLSDNFSPIWKYPANLENGQNGWSIAEDLNQDKIMGLVVEEK